MLFGESPLREIENEKDAAPILAIEECTADQDGDARAVFADVFFFQRLDGPVAHHLLQAQLGQMEPLGRSHLVPAQRQIGSRIARHLQKGFVHVGDVAINVAEHHADNVGLEQPAETGLAPPQFGFDLAALCDFALESRNRLREFLGPKFDLSGQIGVDLFECRVGLLACRDVLGDASKSFHLTGLVAYRRLNHAEPAQLAGGRADAIFELGSPLGNSLEPIGNPLQDEGPIFVID